MSIDGENLGLFLFVSHRFDLLGWSIPVAVVGFYPLIHPQTRGESKVF